MRGPGRPRKIGPKRRKGRPRAVLSLREAERLGKIHCSLPEMAAYFGIADRTIQERYRDDEEFRAAVDRGRSQGQIGLRRMQFRMAKNSPAMSIFLGQQILGQRNYEKERPQSGQHVLIVLPGQGVPAPQPLAAIEAAPVEQEPRKLPGVVIDLTPP